MTKIKIERAEKLISGLGGEKDRWTQVPVNIVISKYLNDCNFHIADINETSHNFHKVCHMGNQN